MRALAVGRRALGADAHVEHPAGAERDLGQPGRTQPWPTSDACWSPASAAMGGAPASARGRAEHAGRVDDPRAAPDAGCAARRAPWRPSPSPSGRASPVTAGVGQVGDVQRRPRDSCHAIQVSTVPTHRSRRAIGVGRVEEVGGLGRRLVGGEPQPLALPDEAVADRAQVLPAEAGTDRLAGGPVPDDGRGPLVGDAHRGHGPALGQRRPGHARGRRRPGRAGRTRPGPGPGRTAAPGGGGRR